MLKRFHSFCNISTERVWEATAAPTCESCLNDPSECAHKHITASIEKKIKYCQFWVSKTYDPMIEIEIEDDCEPGDHVKVTISKEVKNMAGVKKDKWVISDEILDFSPDLRRQGKQWQEVAELVNIKFEGKLFPAQINSAVIRKYPDLRQRHYKAKKNSPPSYPDEVPTIEVQAKEGPSQFIPVAPDFSITESVAERRREYMPFPDAHTVGCVLFPKYCKSPFKIKDAASWRMARLMLGLMAKELGLEE
jgi:hypothetical protein